MSKSKMSPKKRIKFLETRLASTTKYPADQVTAMHKEIETLKKGAKEKDGNRKAKSAADTKTDAETGAKEGPAAE